jgi:hypothetical protein
MANRAKKATAFPVEIVITRGNAGTSDQFYLADSTREAAADDRDGTEDRIAVYALVRVLLPHEGMTFEEVAND